MVSVVKVEVQSGSQATVEFSGPVEVEAVDTPDSGFVLGGVTPSGAGPIEGSPNKALVAQGDETWGPDQSWSLNNPNWLKTACAAGSGTSV